MNINELRKITNKTQKEFAEYLDIPFANIRNWEQEFRNPPEYLIRMIERIMIYDKYLVDTQKQYYSCDNKVPFSIIWKNGRYMATFEYMNTKYEIPSPGYCFAKRDIDSFITGTGFYVDDKVDDLKFLSQL